MNFLIIIYIGLCYWIFGTILGVSISNIFPSYDYYIKEVKDIDNIKNDMIFKLCLDIIINIILIILFSNYINTFINFIIINTIGDKLDTKIYGSVMFAYSIFSVNVHLTKKINFIIYKYFLKNTHKNIYTDLFMKRS